MKKFLFKCKRSFARLSLSALLNKSGDVDKGTTDNAATFVTPEPSNVDFHANKALLITKRNELNAIEIALNQKKQEVDEQVEIVIEDLTKRADYVDGIAKGDEKIVLLSGNEATSSEKHKQPIPGIIHGLVVKATTESGTISANWDPEDHCDQYLVEESSTPMDPKSYKLVASETKSSCVIRDRTPGDIMGYRVVGKNPSGIGLHNTFVVIVIP